jgi:hypothetical protein
VFLSFFGVRTGWVVAGNLAEGAKGTVFVRAIRQGHYVPLEALGTGISQNFSEHLARNYVKINDFMTSGLLVSRRKKNYLYKKQLVSPTAGNVQSFKNYRNLYNAVLHKSKKMYYEDVLKKVQI